MITFMKNNSIEIMRKKLLLLYALNVSDILFTLFLLQTGYFKEVNILMSGAVKNPVVSLILKIILPAFLLYYMYRQHLTAEEEQRKASNVAVNISLSIYSFVNITHLVWLVLLPFLIYYQL